MVVVVTPCRRDMVADIEYKMVVVLAPCRRDMVTYLNYKMNYAILTESKKHGF